MAAHGRRIATTGVYQAILLLCLLLKPPGAPARALLLQSEDVPEIESKRLRPAAVTVEYSARGGLFNQHIANEGAFMLAVALDARRIRWPPARNRDTFDVRYRDSKWTPVNASELYDVGLMKTFAASEYGLEVIEMDAKSFKLPANRMASFVTLWDPATGRRIGKKLPIGVNILHGQHSLGDLVSVINSKIDELVGHCKNRCTARGATPEVKLVLEHPFDMLSSAPDSIVEPVKDHLRFSPSLRRLADGIVSTLTNTTGSDTFNGVHLRVETDANGFAAAIGGACVLRKLYIEAMGIMDFNAGQPVYVASGIFATSSTHDNNRRLQQEYSNEILGGKHASAILHKELLIPEGYLSDVGSEQRAAVDWLVLKQAKRAIGFSRSTFSLQLKQYRDLDDLAPESTMLLNPHKQKSLVNAFPECR